MIYADFNATTPMLNVVKEYLSNGRFHGPFANPNSLHQLGSTIKEAIETCRKNISHFLGVDEKRIIFNL